MKSEIPNPKSQIQNRHGRGVRVQSIGLGEKRSRNQFPVISFQFPVVSCQFPVVGFQLSASSYQFPVSSFQLAVSSCQFPAFIYRLFAGAVLWLRGAYSRHFPFAAGGEADRSVRAPFQNPKSKIQDLKSKIGVVCGCLKSRL